MQCIVGSLHAVYTAAIFGVVERVQNYARNRYIINYGMASPVIYIYQKNRAHYTTRLDSLRLPIIHFLLFKLHVCVHVTYRMLTVPINCLCKG